MATRIPLRMLQRNFTGVLKILDANPDGVFEVVSNGRSFYVSSNKELLLVDKKHEKVPHAEDVRVVYD